MTLPTPVFYGGERRGREMGRGGERQEEERRVKERREQCRGENNYTKQN